jgi:eukaryotic-like serine/threonine-protein kinase
MVSHFGKFTLVQRIGGGRLSQVFRVTREGVTGPAPKVALKRVNPLLIGDSAFVQLLVREAGLLAHLSHESLCCCQELGVIDGCAFLTLDLVDGCTLRALLRHLSARAVKLPSSAVLAIGFQLAHVLQYLHRDCATPLVHLDLSPQNVMISRQGDVKLIDFGIARQIDGENPPPVGQKIAGTVGYMSPEQARGAVVDARADQYGLGILLWEMLAGRRLFRGNTTDTWQRMRNGQTPAPQVFLHDAPEALVAIVTRLLQPEVDKRYRDIAEVVAQMEGSSSSPLSGRRPLAALVQRLMGDTSFDPFDVVNVQLDPEPQATDIPLGTALLGAAEAEAYVDLRIEVDFGEGTPGSMVRAILPERAAPPPISPFLETLPEADASDDAVLPLPGPEIPTA